MKTGLVIFAVVILVLFSNSPVMAQSDEVKLDKSQQKITSVVSARKRQAPQASAKELERLMLGTVVTAVARSNNQDTLAGKTDYWYRVMPVGLNASDLITGWVFGGQLRDYSPSGRHELVKQLIEDQLETETDFGERQEIYDLAAGSIAAAKDPNSRAEFELLKLLALGHAAAAIENPEQDKAPYREWLRENRAQVIKNEYGSGYKLRTELLWGLETKNHLRPVADRIAWEASQNFLPSDCESDEICGFLLTAAQVEYLKRHPRGAHAAEAVKNLNQALTDDVISFANDPSGDEEAARQRTELKKALASLRVALARVSAPEKAELMKKADRAK